MDTTFDALCGQFEDGIINYNLNYIEAFVTHHINQYISNNQLKSYIYGLEFDDYLDTLFYYDSERKILFINLSNIISCSLPNKNVRNLNSSDIVDSLISILLEIFKIEEQMKIYKEVHTSQQLSNYLLDSNLVAFLKPSIYNSHYNLFPHYHLANVEASKAIVGYLNESSISIYDYLKPASLVEGYTYNKQSKLVSPYEKYLKLTKSNPIIDKIDDINCYDKMSLGLPIPTKEFAKVKYMEYRTKNN